MATPILDAISATLSPIMTLAGSSSNATSESTSSSIRDPDVRIILPIERLPQELIDGLIELAKGAARGNVEIVDGEEGRVALERSRQIRGPEWYWVVGFQQVPDFPSAHVEIQPSHEDFTTVPVGQSFEIMVRYKRKCEAYRGFGHVLAITRQLDSPWANPTSDTPHSSDAGASPSVDAQAPGQNSNSNGDPTRSDGADVPPVPSPSSSSSLQQQQTSSSTSLIGSSSSTSEGMEESPQIVDGANQSDGPGVPASGAEANSTSAGRKWTGNVGHSLRREEDCLFETLGIMIDCSRNGVLLVSSVHFILRQLALMGCNMCQLYTEDTYQIKEEPFFGYFRGPYTFEELKNIDDYADNLGIEVIPCIQTLGHLGQMLQWPRFGHMRDTHEVLLAEADETYMFIEKMISSATAPFRTRRIHIGMDEAHGVGEGRYRQIFGYKDSTFVFTDHLKRVNEICQRLDVKPMIWSDMLFCLHAKNNSLQGYYDSANPATPEIVAAIPSEMELVYWDYYHTTPEPYANKVAHHWELARKPPWMASGVWTWSRFWTALPFTFETERASMKASKAPQSGVRHAMTTIWGDEGNECDIWSALPGILYFAEHAYTTNDEVDVALCKRKFDGIVGANFDDYVFASKLDDLQPESQPIDAKSHFTPNMSKWLLWEEPFYSFMSPQYRGYNLERHFAGIANYLDVATSPDVDADSLNSGSTPWTPSHSLKEFPMNSRLRLPQLLAEVLALKTHLRDRLHFAYRQGDFAELEALGGEGGESRLGRLRGFVDEMWRYHRQMWMSTYKPFGWEILELRYGGIRARLETMHERIASYLDEEDSSVTSLPELEVDLEVAYPGNGPNLMLDYHRVSRPQYA